MLNKKKIIAVIATGMIVVVCGVLVYVKFINNLPTYNYIPAPETTITEQHQEYSQDKDVYFEPETTITEQHQEYSQDKDVYFEPDSEPVFIAEPVIDWEEPPVVTVYNPDADLNDDGHVDKEEWEQWVAAHPEDLNQDLYITEEEQAEFNSSINQGNTKPADKPTPPATNNNGMTQKEIDAAKKMSDDFINKYKNRTTDKTQEEIDEFNRNADKGYDW